MRRRFLFLGIVCVVGGVLGLVVCGGLFRSAEPLSTVAPKAQGFHRSYSNDVSLYAAVATSSYTQRYSTPAAGGIVSHHLLANVDIAHFFAEFTDQSVCRVVLVGPSHYFPHGDLVQSTRYDYQTPFGVVRVDHEFVDAMQKKGVLTIDEAVMEEEHSMSSLVPYVAKYLPGATVVPLIFNQRFDPEKLGAVASMIVDMSNDCTIVVASVDFSHHLYSTMADLHDRRSVVALTQFDKVSLEKLEVDSRSALFVATQFFSARQSKRLEVVRQNSAEIFKQYDSNDVTSYVFAHALPGEPLFQAGASVLFLGGVMSHQNLSNKRDKWSTFRGPEGNFMRGYDAVVGSLDGFTPQADCLHGRDDASSVLTQLKKEGVTHLAVLNNPAVDCVSNNEVERVFAETALVPVTTESVQVLGTNKDVRILALCVPSFPAEDKDILKRVQTVAASSTVTVYLRWCDENGAGSHERNREFAHRLIEAGADAIIGNYSRDVSLVEVYQKVPIFYSLGNLFSERGSVEGVRGYVVGMWSGSDGDTFYIFPYTYEVGIPTHVDQETAKSFCHEAVDGTEQNNEKHPCVLRFEK